MQVKIKKLKDGAIIPEYKTSGAACMDLHASVDASVTLQPGEYKVIPTGIAVEVPDSYELQVRARSGWAAKHGIGVVNGIGTIDADYRGEVGVILINWGKEPFVINPGESIAQATIKKFEPVEWVLSNELSETVRGEGKFGSTGSRV